MHGLIATVAGSFRPKSAKLWLRYDRGIILGGTPKATGTLPPVVTFTATDGGALSTLGQRCIRVEIQTTGIRGTATFRASFDDGPTFVVTGAVTAATYDLPSSNVRLNFPVGAYTNDDVYRATVATWKNQGTTGSTHDFTQATASLQPVSTPNGPDFDGVDDYMTSTGALSGIIKNNAYTGFFVGYERTFSNAATSYANDAIITDSGAYFMWGAKDPGTKSSIIANYTGTQHQAYATALVASQFDLMEFRHSGGVLYTRIGNQTEASAASGNTQVLTGTLTIGAVYDHATNFWDGVFKELLVHDSVLDTTLWNACRQYMARQHGVTV